MARFKKPASTSVVVIGLGRFGSAVADSLVRMGQEVLAIDENQALVDRWADDLTHVAQADTTDDQALRQLGVGDFDRAVVAIGTDIEASVLTVLALAEAGVTDVIACPGSRSTPLALAMRAHPGLSVRVLLDERSAGFFALGMARASRRPGSPRSTSTATPSIGCSGSAPRRRCTMYAVAATGLGGSRRPWRHWTP